MNKHGFYSLIYSVINEGTWADWLRPEETRFSSSGYYEYEEVLLFRSKPNRFWRVSVEASETNHHVCTSLWGCLLHSFTLKKPEEAGPPGDHQGRRKTRTGEGKTVGVQFMELGRQENLRQGEWHVDMNNDHAKVSEVQLLVLGPTQQKPVRLVVLMMLAPHS